MRDPNRIDLILNQLRDAWKQQPDMRLGQLLVVMARPTNPCPELFHLEDDQLAHRLNDYASALANGNHKLRYVKRRWDGSRGDGRDWGSSWWHFEIDALNNVIRQVEIYDNGPTIGYDAKRDEDELGGLSKVPLENVVEEYEPIPMGTFNQLWSQCSNRS